MSNPSKAAIKFATRIYAEMFSDESDTVIDVNRMLALAIAFDETERAARDTVTEEREACAAIADANNDVHGNGSAIAAAIRARGAK